MHDSLWQAHIACGYAIRYNRRIWLMTEPLRLAGVWTQKAAVPKGLLCLGLAFHHLPSELHAAEAAYL
jgi:hypothetical protein